ncbi:hypothetical protein MMMDOFMJ_2776 [Methylobacterium gnaphalii]|nr:hypothetical protein MMMDOFMJ_2776 [Methylobacterium gnaphalii]
MAPLAAVGGDGRADVFFDPSTILRMHMVEPPLAGRLHCGEVVAVSGAQGVIPEDMVGLEIPVPDRVVRRPRDQAVALLGGTHGKLGSFAGRHVAHCADEADLAAVDEGRFSARCNPALNARADAAHAILDVEDPRARRIGGGTHRCIRRLAVIGMESGEIAALVGHRVVRADPEHLAHASIPAQALSLGSVIEDADAGGLDREPHALLGFSQRALGKLRALVEAALLGAVAQDLEVTDMTAIGGRKRHDLALSEEARAVLAQVPALPLAAAVLTRGADLPLGEAGHHILGREEGVDRPAQHLGLGPTENPLRPGTPARHPAVEIRRQDRVIDGAVEDLAMANGRLSRKSRSGIALDDGTAHLHLHHHLPGEPLQAGGLSRGEPVRARLMIDDAECPDRLAIRGLQTGSGIEAQMRLAGDEGVRGRARIVLEVRDHEEPRLLQRMRADGLLERRLAWVEADARLEPLPVVGDEADQSNRRLADLCC